MRSYMDFSIRQKLQVIVMATSAAALLVASVVFALFDRSTFLRVKTQDLSAAAKMVGSNSTAALIFGDAKSAAEILSALQAKELSHVEPADPGRRDGAIRVSAARSWRGRLGLDRRALQTKSQTKHQDNPVHFSLKVVVYE